MLTPELGGIFDNVAIGRLPFHVAPKMLENRPHGVSVVHGSGSSMIGLKCPPLAAFPGNIMCLMPNEHQIPLFGSVVTIQMALFQAFNL